MLPGRKADHARHNRIISNFVFKKVSETEYIGKTRFSILYDSFQKILPDGLIPFRFDISNFSIERTWNYEQQFGDEPNTILENAPPIHRDTDTLFKTMTYRSSAREETIRIIGSSNYYSNCYLAIPKKPNVVTMKPATEFKIIIEPDNDHSQTCTFETTLDGAIIYVYVDEIWFEQILEAVRNSREPVISNSFWIPCWRHETYGHERIFFLTDHLLRGEINSITVTDLISNSTSDLWSPMPT